jgi:hypothetical protein
LKKIRRHILIGLCALSALVAGMLPSCIAPNEIEILGDAPWTVYGIVGEDQRPIVFVYKIPGSSAFVYNASARITFRHGASGLSTALVPVIAGDELYYNVNEFPFGEDWSGKIVYYTTPGNLELPGGNYDVEIDLGKQSGSAELYLPPRVGFSKVEIRESVNAGGQNVKRVLMSIADIPGDDLYKWEISIDQVIPVQIPVAFDPVSGEPVAFEDSPVLFSQEITPNNYIDEAKIVEEENEFRYNLTSNFPDFPYTDETYRINVRLRHYSADLVEYFQSIDDQVAGAIFDPFIEPVFIRSNIEGLPGVIGTYAYSQDYWLEFRP